MDQDNLRRVMAIIRERIEYWENGTGREDFYSYILLAEYDKLIELINEKVEI